MHGTTKTSFEGRVISPPQPGRSGHQGALSRLLSDRPRVSKPFSSSGKDEAAVCSRVKACTARSAFTGLCEAAAAGPFGVLLHLFDRWNRVARDKHRQFGARHGARTRQEASGCRALKGRGPCRHRVGRRVISAKRSPQPGHGGGTTAQQRGHSAHFLPGLISWHTGFRAESRPGLRRASWALVCRAVARTGGCWWTMAPASSSSSS